MTGNTHFIFKEMYIPEKHHRANECFCAESNQEFIHKCECNKKMLVGAAFFFLFSGGHKKAKVIQRCLVLSRKYCEAVRLQRWHLIEKQIRLNQLL